MKRCCIRCANSRSSSMRCSRMLMRGCGNGRALEEANRRLTQLAATDGLTGLHNHRYLQEHLVLEVERSLRTGIPLGMLMVDVDHFRQYNNRFGHQTGDEVLRRVARLIAEHRRVNDVVARYGGKSLRCCLSMPITASPATSVNGCGPASKPSVSRRRTNCLGNADDFGWGRKLSDGWNVRCESFASGGFCALFRAKQTGRNRVCIAGEPPLFGDSKAARIQATRVSKSG